MMLIFDFDGVLIDSVREVAVTAFNTLTGKIVTREEEVPEIAFALFLRNRFHVQQIGDSLPLMAWCLEAGVKNTEKTLGPGEYHEIVRKNGEPVTQRTIRLFSGRKRLVGKNRHAWMVLNEPIEPIWGRLAQATGENILLLTNKNIEGTVDLCRHFGLPVPKENIYSGDQGATKIENMHRIIQRFGSSPRYAFLDDSVKNLIEIDRAFNIRNKIVTLYLASWGYCGPDDTARAKKNGYPVVTMDDVNLLDKVPYIVQ